MEKENQNEKNYIFSAKKRVPLNHQMSQCFLQNDNYDKAVKHCEDAINICLKLDKI